MRSNEPKEERDSADREESKTEMEIKGNAKLKARELCRSYDRTDGQGLFVGWLVDVPATGLCISGTDLLRQFYVLPH